MSRTSCNGYPDWVESSKKKVLKSDEWLNFSKELFDTVSVDMKDSGVGAFSSLGVNEKKLLMQKALAKLNRGDNYSQLMTLVSSKLNTALNEKVALHLSTPKLPNADVYSSACEDAIASMLAKWPSAKSRFVKCLNVELSSKLRDIIWNAQLQNDEAKRQYTDLASTSPHLLASSDDANISMKCHNFLKGNPTLKPVTQFRQAASLMRHVVSYDHSKKSENARLSEADYALAVPFVYSTLVNFSSDNKEVLTLDTMSRMVEQHQAFIQKRPEYSKVPTVGRSLHQFSAKVIELLPDWHALLRQIATLFESNASPQAPISSEVALSHFLHRVLRSHFVGYLPIDTAMFVIDQQIIGFDVEGVDMTPFVVAALLQLSRRDLEKCASWRDVEQSFTNCLKNISADQITSTIEANGWSTALLDEMSSQHSPDLIAPVRTEAELESHPWKYWDSEKLVKYHRDLADQKQSKLSATHGITFKDQAESQSDLNEAVNQQQIFDQFEEVTDNLRETQVLLDEERKSKADIIESAEIEIKRLKEKLLFYESRNETKPSVASTYLPITRSLGLTDPEFEDGSVFESEVRHLTPPVSAKSVRIPSRRSAARTPEEDKVSAAPTPVPEEAELVQDEPEQSVSPSRPRSVYDTPNLAFTPEQVMRMLLTKMMEGSQLIVHGYPDEKQALDVQTKGNLRAMRTAYQDAKMTYFNGKPPSVDEFAAFPVDKKKRITERLNEITKNNLIKSKGK